MNSFRFELGVGAADLVLVGLGISFAGAGAGALPVSCLLMALVVAISGYRTHAVAGATVVGALHAWLVLRTGITQATGQQLILQILPETDRATEIIRTVLAYSREPPRFERRATNLLSTLLESVILVRGELPTHVSVDLDVAPDLHVLAHKAKLQQAFVNLMKNSIDAMREGHRDGAISVSASLAGDGLVELVFRDTAAGIPPHVIDRVFDPFLGSAAAPKRKRRTGGR